MGESLTEAPESQLRKKLDGKIVEAKALLARFSEPEWKEVAEASFSKVVSALSSLHTQCGQTAEDEETTLLCIRWSEATMAANVFIKACDCCSGGGADSSSGSGAATKAAPC